MEDKSYETKLSAPAAPPPTWLLNNSASVRPPAQAQASSSSFLNHEAHQHQQVENHRKWCGCEPGSQCVQCSFLHLPSVAAPGSAGGRQGAGPPPPPAPAAMALASSQLQLAVSAATMGEIAVGGSETHGNESMMALSAHHHHLRQQQQELNQGHGQDQSPHAAPQQQQGRASLLDLQQSADTANSSDLVDGEHGVCAAVDYPHHHHQHVQPDSSHTIWQTARLKADISMHPLYDQLLQAHISCLRIATPVDQLPRIDAQISHASQVLAKYSILGQNHLLDGEEKEELDQFMTHYMLLLCTFKEQLQQHWRVHAMEAVMACWELEQSLLSLTGVSPGEGTGATMSDDEDDPAGDSDPCFYDTSFDVHDSGAFGPLIPTETERSLMERVRQELKNELKSGYKDRIVDVREEILRKRRAGKLPGDTTSVLKAWWQAHSKWPYPTEDEKSRLVQETGLQLKQINNWFINQRKRNWHSNPSSTAALKNKRKR